jgi:hypothetical protein
MIQSLLIANRDEIACRIIRTARATLRRPELVSGPMPRWWRRVGWWETCTNSEAWMLKRVQHDRRASRASRLSFHQPPFNPQIAPFGVKRFNEVDLPLPMPPLQLLLARNCIGHPVKSLCVDQADRAIIRRKTWCRPRAMLVQSRRKVRRDANVKRSALLAGENVSAGLSHMNVGNIQRRHAELVSASMSGFGKQTGYIQPSPNNEAWVLKRVQDNGRCGDCNA